MRGAGKEEGRGLSLRFLFQPGVRISKDNEKGEAKKGGPRRAKKVGPKTKE